MTQGDMDVKFTDCPIGYIAWLHAGGCLGQWLKATPSPKIRVAEVQEPISITDLINSTNIQGLGWDYDTLTIKQHRPN